MKQFLYVNHFVHDFSLSDVPRNPIQHERVDIRLELVPIHGRIDCLSPKFHSDVVRDEPALTRVIEECFSNLRTRVDGAEHVATRTMIKPRNRAERFPLRALAAAGCAKKDKRIVSRHQQNPLIQQVGSDAEAESDWLFFGHERIHVHPPTAAIKPNVAVQQRKDCVVAAEPDVLAGQKLCPALAHNDVAGHNHFAAEFFYTQPLADAVAAILNAALSCFVSHFLRIES